MPGHDVHIVPPGVTPGGGLGDNFIDQDGLDEIDSRESLSDLLLARTYGYRFEPTNLVNQLEAFGLNEQRDMLFGRGSEGTLRSLANRVGAEDRAREARQIAARGAQTDIGSFNRATAGLDLSDRQKKLASRTGGLSRAIAQADAGTRSRRQSTDLAIGARAGLQQLEEGAFGQELGGRTMIANAEGQRRERARAEEAAEDSAFWNAITTIGGAIVGGVVAGSSEAWKTKTEEKPKLLDKLKQIRVDKWKYNGADIEHIGPYAEEFNNTFGVGQFSDAIDMISLFGVTLGAVKELNEKVESLG